ncbi:MAG: tetratricopeptide repeat protein [Gemmatimonadetes bacterium]|nr:tetratricopeptide repeat protein [Gemmatimonadota bacterium]MCC7133650.1 tetratricopeptide repeat protein [Gemmatimonadales bacterium]
MIQLDVLGTIDLRLDGAPVRAVLVQPRRLALLTYLAVARPHGFHSRDRLIGLFWPDADQERARGSLRQALHQLRRALGEDAILARGEREIGINPERFRIDAARFDDALEAGRPEEALELYRGDFLPGFFLDGAIEVERFIETERERYRREAVGAAWRIVGADEARGDRRAAASHARRALALAPYDEAGLRRTLTLVASSGDRAGAQRLYDDFVKRLAEDLELTPSDETVRLVNRLRDAGTAPADEPVAASSPPVAASTPSVTAPPAAAVASTQPASVGSSRTAAEAAVPRTALRWRRYLAVAALVVVGALVARAAARPAPPAAEPVAAGAVSALGVLPFANLSGDPANEYLADGITQELVSALARIPGLHVAGSTSVFTFKGKDVPLDSIGRSLRVGHVLEGSIRVTGDRVRIVAALIDVRSGYQAWSEAYDGDLDDVLSMQNAIARSIVAALRPRLGRPADSVLSSRVVNPNAHTQRLLGLQAMRAGGPDDYTAAGRFFERALAIDSNYAEAQAGLASVQMIAAIRGLVPRAEGYAQATRSAERALALDSTVSEAHAVLARIAQDYHWDYSAADRHFRRAIEQSPGDEVSHRQYARLLAVLGRKDEAIAMARRSTDLDPLAPGSYRYLGLAYYYAGRHAEAIESFDRALALDPDQVYTVAYRAYPLSALGRHAEATGSLDRALTRAPDDLLVIAAAGVARAAAGDSVAARRLLARLLERPGPSPYLAAEILATLGDRDGMFAMLERAVAEHDPVVTELGAMPIFEPFRADPRMARLRARLRLP